MGRKFILEIFRHPPKDGDRLKIPQGTRMAQNIAAGIASFHEREGRPLSEVDFKIFRAAAYRTHQALDIVARDLQGKGANVRDMTETQLGTHPSYLDSAIADEDAFKAFQEKLPPREAERMWIRGEKVPGTKPREEDLNRMLRQFFRFGHVFLLQHPEFFDSKGNTIHVAGFSHDPKLSSFMDNVLEVTGKPKESLLEEGEGVRLVFEKAKKTASNPAGYSVSMAFRGKKRRLTQSQVKQLLELAKAPPVSP